MNNLIKNLMMQQAFKADVAIIKIKKECLKL